MKWIFSVMKFFRLVPTFTADDMTDIDHDQSLREHREAVTEVRELAEQRKQGNSRLREALNDARAQIEAMNPLGELEQAMRHDVTPHHIERPGSVRRPNH